MSDQIMKGSSELDALIPELWSAAFYPTLLERLPWNESVAREYEGEIQALGDTVKVPSVPQFDEASELAEDARNDAEGVTISSQSLVVNKQLVKDFIVTSKAMRQSIDSMDRLRDMAIFSILKKMQKIIIAEVVPSASAPDHQIAYDSGTTLALADILEAKELLDTQNVAEGNRGMIAGVGQYNDLFNITGFTSRDFIPNGSPLTEGSISTPVLGFRVKWTTENGNVSHFFSPEFLQMAVQQLPEVKVYDLGGEGKRAVRVNVTALMGVKQMDSERVVSLS